MGEGRGGVWGENKPDELSHERDVAGDEGGEGLHAEVDKVRLVVLDDDLAQKVVVGVLRRGREGVLRGAHVAVAAVADGVDDALQRDGDRERRRCRGLVQRVHARELVDVPRRGHEVAAVREAHRARAEAAVVVRRERGGRERRRRERRRADRRRARRVPRARRVVQVQRERVRERAAERVAHRNNAQPLAPRRTRRRPRAQVLHERRACVTAAAIAAGGVAEGVAEGEERAEAEERAVRDAAERAAVGRGGVRPRDDARDVQVEEPVERRQRVCPRDRHVQHHLVVLSVRAPRGLADKDGVVGDGRHGRLVARGPPHEGEGAGAREEREERGVCERRGERCARLRLDVVDAAEPLEREVCRVRHQQRAVRLVLAARQLHWRLLLVHRRCWRARDRLLGLRRPPERVPHRLPRARDPAHHRAHHRTAQRPHARAALGWCHWLCVWVGAML